MRIVDFFDGFSSATDPSTNASLSDALRESTPDIGVVDNVNTVYTLSYIPLTSNHIHVAVDGVMLKTSEFTVVGTILTLATAPNFAQEVIVWYFHSGTVTPVSAPEGTYVVDYFTLSAGDITNKYVTLSGTPAAPSDVVLDLIGGSSQEYSVDFTVTGSQLRWNGLALDGVLAASDKLRVIYLTA